MTTPGTEPYAARLDVDYPGKLDRLSSAFRIIWAIPILVIAGLLSSGGGGSAGEGVAAGAGGATGGLFFATALMIVVRQRYPRWWFDFAREYTRFGGRVTAYVALLTDRYPSTEEEQSVHLEIDYPADVQQLNRWLPLVKWFLAIPHYIVLIFLSIAAIVAVIIAWFAILFTGQYPRGLFNFVVGVGRWGLRVQAYAFLLLTDKYPPFSLDP